MLKVLEGKKQRHTSIHRAFWRRWVRRCVVRTRICSSHLSPEGLLPGLSRLADPPCADFIPKFVSWSQTAAGIQRTCQHSWQEEEQRSQTPSWSRLSKSWHHDCKRVLSIRTQHDGQELQKGLRTVTFALGRHLAPVWTSGAAVTSDHGLGSFRQRVSILVSFWRLEVYNQRYWTETMPSLLDCGKPTSFFF